MNLSAKVGLGAIWSVEDRPANGETYMGTEINGQLIYEIAPRAQLILQTAYAWTGDFYEVSDDEAGPLNGGTVFANEDPDDIYQFAIHLRVSMSELGLDL
jgi:hypothetical protein